MAKKGTDAKDSDDGKKKKKNPGGTVFGALVFVGIVAALGSGLTGGPGRTQRVAQATAAARAGNPAGAWRALQLTPGGQRVEPNVPCAVNSTGAVHDLLVRTPCRAMRRALYAVADAAEHRIAISVVWVWMPNATAATALRNIEDASGSGHVKSIAGQHLGLGNVPFTGTHYRSRASGALLVFAEAEPAGPGAPAGASADGTLLDDLAGVAAQLPPP